MTSLWKLLLVLPGTFIKAYIRSFTEPKTKTPIWRTYTETSRTSFNLPKSIKQLKQNTVLGKSSRWRTFISKSDVQERDFILAIVFLCSCPGQSCVTLICLFLSVEEENPEFWRSAAQNTLRSALARKINTNVAKNIVLFLGDGEQRLCDLDLIIIHQFINLTTLRQLCRITSILIYCSTLQTMLYLNKYAFIWIRFQNRNMIIGQSQVQIYFLILLIYWS